MNTESLLSSTNKVAMMQPTFLSWQGYFELIHKADTFIFLDDFQYINRSFHSRNRIFVSKEKIDYAIIPLQRTMHNPNLNQIKVLNDCYWLEKFLKRLETYKKTSYYDQLIIPIKNVLAEKSLSLADYNISMIKLFCKILNINTQFLLSSQFSITTHRSQRIYDLLKINNASCYLSANGSFDYMLEDKVFPNNIPVLFQNYQPKPYKQMHSKEFVPYLSILDALFNIGPEETLKLIQNGTEKWLTWDERYAQFTEQNYA